MFVDLSIRDFLAKLGSGSPTPGGGTASAMSAAMSASLLSMVTRISIRKAKDESVVKKLENIAVECDRLSKEMALAMDKDAESFDEVMEALKLPKSTSDEKANRKAKIQIALKGAALSPLYMMENIYTIAEHAEQIIDFASKSVISDIGVSVLLAHAALNGAYYNVKINLKSIKDTEFNEETAFKAKSVFSATAEILDKVKVKVDEKMEGAK